MLAFDMPVEFTADIVLKIAALANLELEPNEIDLFARQLGDILAYADEVQKVDTTGVPPTASMGDRLRSVAGHASDGESSGATADRPDVVQPSLDIAATLANAPDADHSQLQGGFFKVPRVIG